MGRIAPPLIPIPTPGPVELEAAKRLASGAAEALERVRKAKTPHEFRFWSAQAVDVLRHAATLLPP